MQKFGQLFVVATPIGNLADMTPRAIDCLKHVDVIACEDTRTSAKLLHYFQIQTKTWAYHEHNADVQTQNLLTILKNGKNVALISDAGTPLISDPGYRLVTACHQLNIKVSPIVGACAGIAALSVAGLPSDQFYFYGFLASKSQQRQKQLEKLQNMTATLIFYEAPHRILDSLTDMIAILGGDRSVTFCREMTKTFETIYPSTLEHLKTFVENDVNQQKGEMVLVVAGANEKTGSDDQFDDLLKRLLVDLSVKKTAQLAADITGAKKNILYQRALWLSQNG